MNVVVSMRIPKRGLLSQRTSHRFPVVAVGVVALTGAIVASAVSEAVLGAPAENHDSGVPSVRDWPSSGQNNHNTRYAAAEHEIGADNVGKLKPKWIFTTAGNVSATATVADGIVYVPDWGGELWAIDAKTGNAVWSHKISDYTGTKVSASRTSPAYANGVLIVGTGNIMTEEVGPAFEIGINAKTG